MAELISLGLTFPTAFLAGAVIWVWGRTLWLKGKKPSASRDYFILGVVLGFLGSFLDNAYWFVPWSASFLGLSITEDLINAGVFFNIFFRQGAGIAAAWCHLRAAELADEVHGRWLNRLLVISSVAGVAYSILIMIAWASLR